MLETTEFALLRRVAAEQAESRAPSLVAAVVRGQDLLWTGARGSVDGAAPTLDTQYRIGSITKTFIAVLVMRLRDEAGWTSTTRSTSTSAARRSDISRWRSCCRTRPG